MICLQLCSFIVKSVAFGCVIVFGLSVCQLFVFRTVVGYGKREVLWLWGKVASECFSFVGRVCLE